MRDVVQELQKYLIYKQSYSQFSVEIYQSLLPWQGRCAETWITVKLIDLQNTQFGAKIWDFSYIWADLL